VIRLYVIVEGRTEEIIANKLLVPHLSALGIYPTVHSENGGRRWTRWRNHIASWMRHDQKPEARFTTMFDLYAHCPRTSQGTLRTLPSPTRLAG
jgi:hypothetical protein